MKTQKEEEKREVGLDKTSMKKKPTMDHEKLYKQVESGVKPDVTDIPTPAESTPAGNLDLLIATLKSEGLRVAEQAKAGPGADTGQIDRIVQDYVDFLETIRTADAANREKLIERAVLERKIPEDVSQKLLEEVKTKQPAAAAAVTSVPPTGSVSIPQPVGGATEAGGAVAASEVSAAADSLLGVLESFGKRLGWRSKDFVAKSLTALVDVGYEEVNRDRFAELVEKKQKEVLTEAAGLDPSDRAGAERLNERLKFFTKLAQVQNHEERIRLIDRAYLENKISEEENKKFKEKPDILDLVKSAVDDLAEKNFTGLKELRDKNPEDFRKMSGEIVDAYKIDDPEEFKRKLKEISEKYNLTGEAKKSMRDIKGGLEYLHKIVVASRRLGGVSQKEMTDAQQKLGEMKKEAFGFKEGLATAGFIGGALLLAGFIALIICLAIMEKMMNIKPPGKR